MPESADQLAVEVDGRQLTISNLDKVLYPGTETTKGEVLHYYATVAPALLPVLARRPVTRVRWPHGTGDESFFEKNLGSRAPSWMKRVTITGHGSRGNGEVTYPLVDSVAGLTYLANLAALELHVPQWRVTNAEPGEPGEPGAPDRLVIDLDPGAPAGLAECARLALVIRDRLRDIGIDTLVPVTSGSKGMQLYAHLNGDTTSDQARDLARELAQQLTSQLPDLVVWKMTKSLRPGKVLIDWSQNVAAKTTIAPYSLRGKDRPTVAAPRTWDEVTAGAREKAPLEQLDAEQVLDRLQTIGDLFEELD